MNRVQNNMPFVLLPCFMCETASLHMCVTFGLVGLLGLPTNSDALAMVVVVERMYGQPKLLAM